MSFRAGNPCPVGACRRVSATVLGTSRTLRGLLASAMLVIGCDRRAPYPIGVVLDDDGVRGAKLAAATVNARGGVDGHLVELHISGVDTWSARGALEAAERLASDESVLAVIGHANSSASLAASQVYNARHLVQIAPTSSAPMYSSAGPYSFRLVPSDVHAGVFLARQIVEHAPRARVAVVFVNDDYGRALHGALTTALRESGIGVVYASSFAEDNRFAGRDDLVAALANTHPDLLVWIGRDQQYDLILGALKQRLPRLMVLASDAFDGDVLARDTLNRFAGIRLVRFTDRHRADSVLSKLQKRYGALGGGNMNDQALLSYDAVELLAEAMRHAGPNRAAIREWLSRVGKTDPPFNGVSGAIAFRNGGDRQPAYFLEHIGTPVQSSAATAGERTWTPE